VVLPAGGDGLLLLNDRHPANASGSKRTIRAIRIEYFLQLRTPEHKASSVVFPFNNSCVATV
jgi:hypothetical protein